MHRDTLCQSGIFPSFKTLIKSWIVFLSSSRTACRQLPVVVRMMVSSGPQTWHGYQVANSISKKWHLFNLDHCSLPGLAKYSERSKQVIYAFSSFYISMLIIYLECLHIYVVFDHQEGLTVLHSKIDMWKQESPPMPSVCVCVGSESKEVLSNPECTLAFFDQSKWVVLWIGVLEKGVS